MRADSGPRSGLNPGEAKDSGKRAPRGRGAGGPEGGGGGEPQRGSRGALTGGTQYDGYDMENAGRRDLLKGALAATAGALVRPLEAAGRKRVKVFLSNGHDEYFGTDEGIMFTRERAVRVLSIRVHCVCAWLYHSFPKVTLMTGFLLIG